MTVNSEKNDLRQQFKSPSANDLLVDSSKLQKTLKEWEIYNKTEKVAFYLAMKDEIDVNFLFNSEKQLFLPRYVPAKKVYEMAQVLNENDLTAGKYGILEPAEYCRTAEKNEIELWFVPGVAFDEGGHRLGRGGGFYDRLLADEKTLKVGVVEHSRLTKDIPTEKWDIKMDFVLTDKILIKVNNKE